MKEKVKNVIEQLRPYLQADGGDVELVSVDGTVVKVRLSGACGGCPMSQVTMTDGVEKMIKEAVPEVTRVVQV